MNEQLKRPVIPCKQDCPDRWAECRKTCEAYQAYEKEIFAFYKAKDKPIAQYQDITEIERARRRKGRRSR